MANPSSLVAIALTVTLTSLAAGRWAAANEAAELRDLSITIIQPEKESHPEAGSRAGRALVRERRVVELPSGKSELRLEMPATLLPETISLDSDDGSVMLLQQEFSYDAATPDSLLRAQLGRDILVNRRRSGPDQAGQHPETINARLLAFNEHWLALGVANRQLPVQLIPRQQEIAEIKLLGHPAGPTTRPTLICAVDSQGAGTREIELMYEVSGMEWRAEYNLFLNHNQSAGALRAWMTIANQTGADYPSARVRLAHGNALGRMETYLLDDPIALRPRGSRQVALFPGRLDLSISKRPVFLTRTPDACAPDERDAALVHTCLIAVGSGRNGIGRALPPGRLRVLQEAQDGTAILPLAQQIIAHTPADARVVVKLAPADEIRATLRRSIAAAVGNAATPDPAETVVVTLENLGRHRASVLVIEPLAVPGARIIEASAPIEHQDSRAIHFTIDVPAEGRAALEYTLQHRGR